MEKTSNKSRCKAHSLRLVVTDVLSGSCAINFRGKILQELIVPVGNQTATTGVSTVTTVTSVTTSTVITVTTAVTHHRQHSIEGDIKEDFLGWKQHQPVFASKDSPKTA
jgi:hypothetical protein